MRPSYIVSHPCSVGKCALARPTPRAARHGLSRTEGLAGLAYEEAQIKTTSRTRRGPAPCRVNGFTDDDFPMFPSSSRVQRAGGNRAGLYSRRKSPPRAPDDKGAGAGEKGRDGKPRRRKRGRPPKKSLSVAMGEAAAPEAKEAAPSRGREMSQAFSKFPFSIAQLEALKWIAERRSVSAAAKWSGLKETTLRVRIRSLQRALQMPLFSRTVEPWRLSEAGVILYHYSTLIIGECLDTMSEMADLGEVSTGRVRLGGSQTVGVELMPQMVRKFLDTYPGVRVQLAVESTRKIALAVASGELDAGLVGGTVPRGLVQRGLEVDKYLEDRILLVCAPDDPIWAMGPISRDQIRQLRFVSINRSSTVYARQAELLQRHGVDARDLSVVFEVNSVEAVKNAVQEGIGVGFVSAAAAVSELRAGLLKEVRVNGLELSRELLLLTNKKRYLSRAAKVFLDSILGFRQDLENSTRCASPIDGRDFYSIRGHIGGGDVRAEERDLEVEGDGDGEGEMEPGGNGVFRAEGRASAWKRTWAGKGWDGEASAEGREREGEEEGYEGGEGGEGVKRAQSPLMWSSDVARKMWGAEMSVIEGLEEAVEDGARSGMEGREGKEEEDGLIGGSVKDKLNDLDELRPEAEKVVGLAFFSEDQELAWVADRGKARGGRRSDGYLSDQSAWQQRLDYLSSLEDVTVIPFKLDHLVVLRAAARKGTFAEVAKELGVTAARVTMSVQDLEKAMKCRVFDRRTGSKCSVSPEGRILVDKADRIVRLCSEAMVALKDLDTADIGTLFLGASQTTGAYMMPRLLSVFKARHPEVSVRLTVDDSPLICELVARGDLDAAIVGGGVPLHLESQLSTIAYSQDEIVIAVGRQHPWAERKVIEADELFQHEFITLNDDSRLQGLQEQLMSGAGVRWEDLKVTMQLNSVEAIKNAVQFNLGAAFLSITAISKEVDLGLLKRVRVRGTRLVRKLQLVTYQRRYHTRAARVFVQEIFNVAMDIPPGSSAPADIPFLRTVSSKPWEMPDRGGERVGAEVGDD